MLEEHEIYYRIYNKDGELKVVCMQDFDEIDYDQNKFILNEEGENAKFWCEQDANDILNIVSSYKHQDKYKLMWEELKEVLWKLVDEEKQENKFWYKRELKDDIDDKMQELEQKYNIGSEDR